MLINNLYQIVELENIENVIHAAIELNKEHEIFKGHFPDVPVLPGVVMMQMCKEIIENVEGLKLQILKAANMKFLMMLNPEKTNNIKVEILLKEKSDELIKIQSKISSDLGIHFKMSAQLSIL